MARRTGTITERSKGRFQIRYTLGVDPLTGKRKRYSVSVEGKRQDAEKTLRGLLKTVDDNSFIEPTRKSTGQYLEEWINMMRSQISPKTHERYSEIVYHFLIPAFGAIQLTKLDPASIQRAYTGWETSGRRDNKSGGFAPRTRLHIHRILKHALKHAVRMRIIAYNPADAVIPPKAKRTAVTTLTIEQSTILLDALRVSHPCVYWPVLLALTTGMRRGEIAALRWKNVDFEKKTIRVVESVEQVKQNIRLKAPKTDKTRAVMLPDYALEELKCWKEAQTHRLRTLNAVPNDDTFVCGRSWDGGMIKPDSLTAEFRVAIRDIPDFPIVRFHDLRHSHATQLLMQGIHPKIAQERLGHSTITTTLDLYSHVTDTMQTEAVEKLDTAFRSAIKSRLKNDPQPG